MPAHDLDQTMQQASIALVEMRYLEAERLCLDALDVAIEREDWSYVARIVLPLQEARRQRRMIAADTAVQLGTLERDDLAAWINPGETRGGPDGCLLITRPCTIDDARSALRRLRELDRYAEVLFADIEVEQDPAFDADDPWPIVSLIDDEVSVECAAPCAAWLGRPLHPGEADWHPPAATADAPTPADWFMDVAERLGDAAIAAASAAASPRERFEHLHRLLDAAPDHELLHQALADAARARMRTKH